MLGVVSLPWVVFSLIISRLIILIGYVYFIHRYHVIHWIKAQFHWVMGKELLSFGAWMTLSNMIGPIMVVADRFIISFALGAAWVAYYTVPADLLFYVLFIPSALSVALFPKFAFMSQNDVVAMRSMYMRSVKVVAAVMLVFSVFVMCFAYPGLVWWLGKSFAEKSYWHWVYFLMELHKSHLLLCKPPGG
jgi:O-antigen/teichoic acid export membrane protein